MCLSDVVRLVEVSADGATGIGDDDGSRVEVSLAVLTLDGVRPEIGDWVVVTTGLAVERLDAADAAAVRRERARLGGSNGGSNGDSNGDSNGWSDR